MLFIEDFYKLFKVLILNCFYDKTFILKIQEVLT